MMMVFKSSDIAGVCDWDSLVRVSHAMALEKGWWHDGVAARPLDEIVANFHAEVSEAWEAYRDGKMETWYSGNTSEALRSGGVPKPEGFWVELADLVIRVADAAGAHKIDALCCCYQYPPAGTASFICYLHRLIADKDFTLATGSCFYFAQENEHDLWATIREKLAYNATRPHRHGGKLA